MSIINDYKKVMHDEPAYFKMIIANAINRFGDAIDVMALGFLVYQITSSATWVAVILGANLIPTIVLQPLAGVWVNHMNKKKTMILTDIIRGGLVVIVALLIIFNLVTPILLLCVTILISTAEAFRQPCGLAVTSGMLKKENYTIAISLNQSASKAGQLIGMAAAGLVISLLGATGAMFIDALTFFVSGIILCFTNISESCAENEKTSLVKEFKDGWKYFVSIPMVLTCTLCCFLVTFVEVPLLDMKVVYIEDYLSLSSIGLTANGISMAIGLFLGAVFAPKLCKLIKPAIFLTTFGIFSGITMILHILITGIPNSYIQVAVYAVIIFIYAFITSGFGVVLVVVLMEKTESQYMSRVGGIFNSLASFSQPISSFILGIIVLTIPLKTVYLFYGIGSVIVFTIISILSSRSALNHN